MNPYFGVGFIDIVTFVSGSHNYGIVSTRRNCFRFHMWLLEDALSSTQHHTLSPAKNPNVSLYIPNTENTNWSMRMWLRNQGHWCRSPFSTVRYHSSNFPAFAPEILDSNRQDWRHLWTSTLWTILVNRTESNWLQLNWKSMSRGRWFPARD